MRVHDRKIAIVIGGTRGIGAAISRRLAINGASIGATFLSRSKDAECLAGELRSAGHHALMVQADVSDGEALNDAIDQIVKHFGRLDILVSVAGTAIVGPLEAYPDDAFDRTFALNVRAPFLAAKKAAGLMTEGGRIVTIGSIVADRMPGVGGTLYAASKAALGGMTRGLARDLGERGITANLVQPGPIDTERNPADGPNAVANRSPLAIPRHGTPDEVASLVAYLTSPEAGFVTGAAAIDSGSRQSDFPPQRSFRDRCRAAAGTFTAGKACQSALISTCLRYPGRHLRHGETLPAIMLDHIAEQIGVDADILAAFARRGPTRYEQLALIKRRHGLRELTHPLRKEVASGLVEAAIGLVDGRILIERLIDRLRAERIVIPGVTVVERMAAEAMHAAERQVIADIDRLLSPHQRKRFDALLSDKEHSRKSRLSWLREPATRVGSRSLADILDKLEHTRATGAVALTVPAAYHPRLAQMAREGVRYTAQAFQQMAGARRYATLIATVRELEATLTDAAITMFRSLVARANLRARKRLEATIAASADGGRERLLRIADVLETLAKAARSGGDVVAAVTSVASLATIEADAALIRRTTKAGRIDVIGELAPECRVFKLIGSRFLASFAFEGRASTAPLRAALDVLVALGGDRRKALPTTLPLGHIERRWHRHVVSREGVDRTYWELATYFALADALAAGDIWVPTSRLHRSLDALITAPASALPARVPVEPIPSADDWLATASAKLDAGLLDLARGLSRKGSELFAGEKLRFPKEIREVDDDRAKQLALRSYGLMPTMRITDVLSSVSRWTGFVENFGHVSTGLPPTEERTFLAALIAEATNLGLSRMAEVCDAGSRRALLRMQTWHMREETFRAALGCLTDAIHAEPLAEWFGAGVRASSDGQAFNLGGPGEAGGQVNAHYGRDPIVKIYTTITDRYAPLHQTVIAGTAGEAVHTLDGLLGHDSSVDIRALSVDGGGVSDIIFAVMHLLGIAFEPRIPRLSDRRLYAFEPRARYGRLAPLFGQRLDAGLIRTHWDEIGPIVTAMRSRTVTPSLILKKLSAYRQQNGVAAALREIGRVERTLFTLRWFNDPALRRLVTGELNKGEARNSLARAVAFHRLGRFRDRGHENQQTRAAALNLVTAAIILFNCRYLGRALGEMRSRRIVIDESLIPQLSPLGWDHINLTGDYVWSDAMTLDGDGFMPLRQTMN